MSKKLFGSVALWGLLFWYPTYQLEAQVVITDDHNWPSFPDRTAPSSPIQLRSQGPDTLSIGLGQPFFDDFSYQGPLPDSNRWFIADNNIDVPYVNKHRAIAPPTQGVATFDGINRFNEPYNAGGISDGICDRLATHYIDLSGFQSSDNVKLSFAIEPQGKGDKPELADSFFVSFYLPELNQLDRVYSISGRAGPTFRQVIVPIEDDAYFRAQFQVIFESWGTQSGKLDEWHLDYVHLAPGRALNDTTFDDLAPVEVEKGPLWPYTAVPMAQFDPSQNWMKPVSILFSNLSTQNKTATVTTTIKDPVGNNPFVGLNQQDRSIQFPSLWQKSENFGPFSNQYFVDPGTIELNIQIPSGSDQVPTNNLWTDSYRIDSVFAYDDGVADLSVGLNKAWGLGNRYVIPRPDSLVAIWISFVPTINRNPITTLTTYMEETPFRLTVWDDPHPDSILVQQIAGAKVNYGDHPDYFHRYQLTETVAVEDTIWVGITQTTTDAIGVGFDTQYPSNDLVWMDAGGMWVNFSLDGVFMIRPELKSRENFGPAAIEPEAGLSNPLRLYPNPLRDRQLTVFNAGSMQPDYEARLFSASGQELAVFRLALHPGENSILLPLDLEKGLYFWQHKFGNNSITTFEKLLVTH